MHNISGSQLEKREMEIMMNAINTIDDNNIHN